MPADHPSPVGGELDPLDTREAERIVADAIQSLPAGLSSWNSTASAAVEALREAGWLRSSAPSRVGDGDAREADRAWIGAMVAGIDDALANFNAHDLADDVHLVEAETRARELRHYLITERPGGVQDTPAREEWRVLDDEGEPSPQYVASEREARDLARRFVGYRTQRRTVTEWADVPTPGEETTDA